MYMCIQLHALGGSRVKFGSTLEHGRICSVCTFVKFVYNFDVC